MSSFVLKIIAVISMFIDHSGYVIFNGFSFMNYIGRLAFPIFAFSITEGYIHTSNLKKYFLRLFIFAIISQIPYMLFLSTFTDSYSLNILFTFILGLIAITVYNKLENKTLGLIFLVLCLIIAQIFHFDYDWFGIAIIFIFYILKKQKLYMNIFFLMSTFIKYFYMFMKTSITKYWLIMLFCMLAIIPINLYNGKKGKSFKYLFYVFYPLHLILLFLLSFVI